jgi:dienelactone hydrolase
MAEIALFHSVLGLRPGVSYAAERLRGAGHHVRVVDQYDGRVFNDYETAATFAESIGYPELMRRATAAVDDLPDDFVAAGFSNGGGMAEYVATRRPVSGVLLLSGALPLDMLGAQSWPAGVPAQIHCTTRDPFRRQEGIDTLISQIRVSGSPVEVFDYDGAGHLFTDPSLPSEYDAVAAELLWQRALAFCQRTSG